jgi:hypothetical protein
MTLDLLRDPIWQFIGAILGIIAIVVSVYLFLLQRNRKSLAYKIETETALLTVTDELRGKLQIIYEGVPVQNVHLIILKIISDGNLPIASNDFEKPLNFSFGDEAVVLGAEIIKTNPITLKPKLNIMEGKISLEPTLLNSKDTLTIKVIISQFGGVITPDARIVGVSNIKKVVGDKVSTREVMTSFFIYSILAFTVMFLVPPRVTLRLEPIAFVLCLSISATIAHWAIRKYFIK